MNEFNNHLKGESFKAEGYKIESAEWKKTAQGRFLMLKYKRNWNGETYRGYARKTIKNGYTILLDYKVFGRAIRPDFDFGVLRQLSFVNISFERDVTEKLWSEKEKLAYAATPLFLLRAEKPVD